MAVEVNARCLKEIVVVALLWHVEGIYVCVLRLVLVCHIYAKAFVSIAATCSQTMDFAEVYVVGACSVIIVVAVDEVVEERIALEWRRFIVVAYAKRKSVNDSQFATQFKVVHTAEIALCLVFKCVVFVISVFVGNFC